MEKFQNIGQNHRNTTENFVSYDKNYINITEKTKRILRESRKYHSPKMTGECNLIGGGRKASGGRSLLPDILALTRSLFLPWKVFILYFPGYPSQTNKQ